MWKVCPSCNTNLTSSKSVELVYASEKRWYHPSNTPIEYYFRCKKCDIALDRKKHYLSLVPPYLVMFILLLGKGDLFPKELIWHVAIPATFVAVIVSILISTFIVKYEKREN